MRNEDWNNIFGDTPEEFHKSVNSALEKIAEREETNMSRSMGIRKIVVAAAVVAAFGVTAIAAMKAAGLESHTDLRDAVYSVSEIQELSDDEDFGVKYIDEFSNGYKFEVGYPSVGKATDADGNTIKEYTSFAVEYKNGDSEIVFFTEPNSDVVDMPTDCETVDVDGTTVYTMEDTYKFVPPDYEMTEQDKEDEASGKYIFSYGTDEVEIQNVKQVMWKEGSVICTILEQTGTLDMDELVSMAEEVMNL